MHHAISAKKRDEIRFELVRTSTGKRIGSGIRSRGALESADACRVGCEQLSDHADFLETNRDAGELWTAAAPPAPSRSQARTCRALLATMEILEF
ncbi:hypothetical protein [Bradyrhizobium sp. USDA 4353]